MEKNVLLYQILQNLNEKYNGIKKTKEECSKYLFRKSFKFIKKNLEESQKGMMKKKIKKFYLEKYFKNKNDQKEPNQLLPFKKNSLVKRINQKYLKVLFSNENYLKEFEKFIEKYDSFVEIENQKKITKFVKQILQLIKENKIEDIKRIQHCPWLKSWIMGCKKMGQEILKEAIAQKR